MLHLFGTCSSRCQVEGTASPDRFNIQFSGPVPQLPYLLVRNVQYFFSQFFVFSCPRRGPTNLLPKFLGRLRFPASHMNPIGDMAYRHFGTRPSGKKRLKQVTAHLTM